MSDTLLVTGASGQLGKRTVEILLESGVAPDKIIATTREPSKLSDLAQKGVDVRRADFNDPGSLVEAFSGATRLALISTDAIDGDGTRLRQHQQAVEAAVKAGIRHIVYTSMPDPAPDSPITFAGDHRGTEEAIEKSGLTYTILRNTWYQENLIRSLAPALASGKWYSSAGEGKVSHVGHEDCARALAAALKSDRTVNEVRTLTGPELYTTAEIAGIASDVLGKPIEVVDVTDEQLGEGLRAAGVPDFMIPFVVGFDTNTRQGRVGFVTGDVQELTGRSPRTLRAFFEENKAAFAG